MRYLPISLDVRNRRCLVAGGGKIAERKIQTLLKFSAKVILVSPKITKQLSHLARQGKIKFIKDRYCNKYLDKVFLIIAATGKKSINKSISLDAGRKNILINCVDDKENSNFISPAIFKGKNFTVAVSTDGRSPVLAKRMRNKIQDLLCLFV